MAVFEYRGSRRATGKPVNGVRDAENAKVLRAVLRRKDGVLLTVATGGGDREARTGEGPRFVRVRATGQRRRTSR